MHGEHARQDTATSAAPRPEGQWVYPVGGGLPAGHTQAAQQQQGMGPALLTASSQDMSHASAQTPRTRQQAQPNPSHETQGTDHSETAYDTADDEAASELGLVPSPGMPSTHRLAHDVHREVPTSWNTEALQTSECTCRPKYSIPLKAEGMDRTGVCCTVPASMSIIICKIGVRDIHVFAARPQPRSKSHSAPEDAPAPDVHSDPCAGFEEGWEGESSEAEETTHHQVNPVGGNSSSACTVHHCFRVANPC